MVVALGGHDRRGLGGIPRKLAPHIGPVLLRGKAPIWNLISFQPPSAGMGGDVEDLSRHPCPTLS